MTLLAGHLTARERWARERPAGFQEQGALGLGKMRRASESWQRDVAIDLRSRVVLRALDELRDKGALRVRLTTKRASDRARGQRLPVSALLVE